MWKLQQSSAPSSVLLSPGIGCYLSVITSLQERMMTIPDPVANTACTEETSLTCGRKEKKKKIQSSGQREAQSLQPASPLGCQCGEGEGTPPPRSRPQGSGQTDQQLPARSCPARAPSILLPLPPREDAGLCGELRPAPRRGKAPGRQPPRFLSPPFSALGAAQGRAPAGRVAGQPARGRVGRTEPGLARTWC